MVDIAKLAEKANERMGVPKPLEKQPSRALRSSLSQRRMSRGSSISFPSPASSRVSGIPSSIAECNRVAEQRASLNRLVPLQMPKANGSSSGFRLLIGNQRPKRLAGDGALCEGCVLTSCRSHCLLHFQLGVLLFQL